MALTISRGRGGSTVFHLCFIQVVSYELCCSCQHHEAEWLAMLAAWLLHLKH